MGQGRRLCVAIGIAAFKGARAMRTIDSEITRREFAKISGAAAVGLLVSGREVLDKPATRPTSMDPMQRR
jgi:hypothetical protein